MESQTITFEGFKPLADEACEARIVAARRKLGARTRAEAALMVSPHGGGP